MKADVRFSAIRYLLPKRPLYAPEAIVGLQLVSRAACEPKRSVVIYVESREIAQVILDHEPGRNPTPKQIREAERVASLHPEQQKTHPSALPADHGRLDHINTYGPLPEFYIDKPFTCRLCGKVEIWKAYSQKWYYEEAKGHIDSTAVECHDCRKSKKQGR